MVSPKNLLLALSILACETLWAQDAQPVRYYTEAYLYSDGVACVKIAGIDGYCYINGNGNLLSYSTPFPGFFHDGWSVYKQAEGRFGYFNNEGTMTVPLMYTEAHSFRNGWARVAKDNQEFYINMHGMRIGPFKKGSIRSDFHCDRAVICTTDKKGRENWALMNSKGARWPVQIADSCKVERITNFEDDLAFIQYSRDGTSYVQMLTRSGELNGEPVAVKTIGEKQSGGMVEYQPAGKSPLRGFLKHGPAFALEASAHSWTEVSPFVSNRAKVAEKNVLGDDLVYYIDPDGKRISEYYSDGRPFNGLFAAVCRKSGWGVIDRHGKEIVPCNYAFAEVSEGIALLLSEEGFFYRPLF